MSNPEKAGLEDWAWVEVVTDNVEKVMHGRDGRATMHGQDAHATNGRNSRLCPASLSGFTEGYAETSEATPGQVAGEGKPLFSRTNNRQEGIGLFAA